MVRLDQKKCPECGVMCHVSPYQADMFEIGGPGAMRMVLDPYSGQERWYRSEEAQVLHSCARAKAKKPVTEKLAK